MASIYGQPEGSVAGTVQSDGTVSSTDPGHHTKKLICGKERPASPHDPFELCDMCRGKMVCWIVQHFLYPDKDTVRLFWPVSNASQPEAEEYMWTMVKKPLDETDLLLSSHTWSPNFWSKRLVKLARGPWAYIGLSAKPSLRPYSEGYGLTITEEIIGLGGRRLLAVMRAAADRSNPLVENVRSELWDYINVKGPGEDWLQDPALAWEWYDSIDFTPESPPVRSHDPGYVQVSRTAPSSVPRAQGQLPASSSLSSPAATGHAPPPATVDPRHPAAIPSFSSSEQSYHTSMVPQPLRPASQQQSHPQQPGLAASLYSGGPLPTQSPHQLDAQASVAPTGPTYGTTASTSIPQPGSHPPAHAQFVHPAHVAPVGPRSQSPAHQQQPQAPLASGEHTHPASSPVALPPYQAPPSTPANYTPQPAYAQSPPPPQLDVQSPPVETSYSVPIPTQSHPPAAPPSSNLGQAQPHPGAQTTTFPQQQQQQQQQQHQSRPEQQMASPTYPPATPAAQPNPPAVATSVVAETCLPGQTMSDPISVEVNDYKTRLQALRIQLEEDRQTEMEERYSRHEVDKAVEDLKKVQARGGRYKVEGFGG